MFYNSVCVHRLHQLRLCIGCALTQFVVKADTLREPDPFINDNSLQVPDKPGVSLALIFLPMTSQTCKHGKHMHMNNNNVDGTGGPSNKIKWISFNSYNAMAFFHLLSMTNELK